LGLVTVPSTLSEKAGERNSWRKIAISLIDPRSPGF
jgi:hypothetical protein